MYRRYVKNPAQPPSCAVGAHLIIKDEYIFKDVFLFNLLGEALTLPLAELSEDERILRTADFSRFVTHIRDIDAGYWDKPDQFMVRVLDAARAVGRKAGEYYRHIEGRRDRGHMIGYWSQYAGGYLQSHAITCSRRSFRRSQPEVVMSMTGWVMANSFRKKQVGGQVTVSFGPLLYYSAMQTIRDNIVKLRRQGNAVGWEDPSGIPVGIMSDRSPSVSVHAQRFWEGIFERALKDRQLGMLYLPKDCQHSSCRDGEEAESYLNYGFYAKHDLTIGGAPVDMLALRVLFQAWQHGFSEGHRGESSRFWSTYPGPFIETVAIDGGDGIDSYIRGDMDEWSWQRYASVGGGSKYVKCEETVQPFRFLRKKTYTDKGPTGQIPARIRERIDSAQKGWSARYTSEVLEQERARTAEMQAESARLKEILARKIALLQEKKRQAEEESPLTKDDVLFSESELDEIMERATRNNPYGDSY